MINALDFEERFILAHLQERQDAVLTIDRVDSIARLGSTGALEAALVRLVGKGLVVIHRDSGRPPSVTLTLAGRSFREAPS